MKLAEEYKKTFSNGNIIVKLILINVSVFAIIALINAITFLFYQSAEFGIVRWLGVPASFLKLATRPWTPITYMFLHTDFLHILFNMLWLYWLGVIFVNNIGERQLLTVYLLGGLSGAVLYIIAYNGFPVFSEIRAESFALGASASVMAIILAVSVYRPDYEINMLFIGSVKLKYIAIFSILIDIMMIPSLNSGGHIAHIGGSIFGIFYSIQLKNGKDISVKFQKLLDNIANLFTKQRKPKMTVHKNNKATNTRNFSDHDYNKIKVDEQKEIDRILDKISKSGYKSLTKEERDLLFKQSNK